jgi:hypothetical protein
MKKTKQSGRDELCAGYERADFPTGLNRSAAPENENPARWQGWICVSTVSALNQLMFDQESLLRSFGSPEHRCLELTVC